MSLIQDAPKLIQHWKDNAGTLEHNAKLFNIMEGDLLPYVLEELRAQLTAQSFESAKHRVAPINVLRRIVDKLSKIYAKPPLRTIEGGAEKDKQLLDWYTYETDINAVMTAANMFFNLFKNSWVEPFLDRGFPRLRVIPSDRFFVYSDDAVNPLRPTHLGKIMGKHEVGGKEKAVIWLYSANEFTIVDEDGYPIAELLSRPDVMRLEGKNPYGALPGVYLNRSKYILIPKIDTDTLKMTTLIPVMLTDLNYAVMYQAFSLLYTIDVNQEGFKTGPNVILDLKSDQNSDKKPEIGSIKPEVDSDKVLSLIKSELSFWMQSRNIKPGAMGDLTVETAASGISKAIDEMDTSEDRQAQVPHFKQAEADLWDLIINRMHPVWMKNREFGKKIAWTPGAKVLTQIAEQRPITDSTKAITDQKEKIGIRIQSRRGALAELYPDWTPEQIEERLKEVDEEARERAAEGSAGEGALSGQPKPDEEQEGMDGSMEGAGQPKGAPKEMMDQENMDAG